MKYNGEEVTEVFTFDGKPKDMLVWNDEEPVIRQVVAKIDGDTPWIAALTGDHHEGGDEASFGAWKHAAELNEPLMTNRQMAEYVKFNNMLIQFDTDYFSMDYAFLYRDIDCYVPEECRLLDLRTGKILVPTKKLYNRWKNYVNTKYVPCKFNVGSIKELL